MQVVRSEVLDVKQIEISRNFGDWELEIVLKPRIYECRSFQKQLETKLVKI